MHQEYPKTAFPEQTTCTTLPVPRTIIDSLVSALTTLNILLHYLVPGSQPFTLFPPTSSLIKHSYHPCEASLCLYPLLTLAFCLKLWQSAHSCSSKPPWSQKPGPAHCPKEFQISSCLLSFNNHLVRQVLPSQPSLTERHSWCSNFHSSNFLITSWSEFTEFTKLTCCPHLE